MEDLKQQLEIICGKIQELLEEHGPATGHGVSIENIVFKVNDGAAPVGLVKPIIKLGFTCTFNSQGQYVCRPE